MRISLEFTTSENLAYIEFYDDKKMMSINYDDDIAYTLGLELDEYKKRFRKIYDNRFIIGLSENKDLYLSTEILKSIPRKKIIDKFKEEFYKELILAVI